jgi:hypothetical protein
VPLKSYRTVADVGHDKNPHHHSVDPDTEKDSDPGMRYLYTGSKDHLESKNLVMI